MTWVLSPLEDDARNGSLLTTALRRLPHGYGSSVDGVALGPDLTPTAVDFRPADSSSMLITQEV
jgi:hypothetical protein